MAGLIYVGKVPAESKDIETRASTEDVLNSGISRDYVAGRVIELSASKATKVYVDNQDNLYADASYYPSRDALLVPNGARGTASGVASLDNNSKVPSAQVPVLGAGILRGPYGPNTMFGGTTGATPLKVAQWNAFTMGYTGQLLAWGMIACQSVDGRTVVEIRAGTSTQVNYADQTLIAQGYGRQLYNDYQYIAVVPVTALDNEGADGLQDALDPRSERR